MTEFDELQQVANDYVAGRVNLAHLSNWLNDRIERWVELPDDAPQQQLWGFIQIRIYDMDHGMPEDELHRELTEYLTMHGLLQPVARERATG